jgi:GNAT superfamily N-acetyltransferase
VVDPKARRRGIATIMMDFMNGLAKQHGCLGLWLVSGFGRAPVLPVVIRPYAK